MTTEQAERGAIALDVKNNSTIGQFLWIGFYSSIFTLLTLTIFRFWARTIVRKRLWADTTIGGTPLEYTGKGSELFIGFLIAIVTVMVPIVGAIVAAQLLLPPIYTAVVIAVVYLGFFILIGVALFLARRYQLSRTNWRGVRFEQRGSPWAYGFIAFGYGLLSAITLGWFAPAMRLRLEKRMWNNAFFGDMAFTYDNSKEARTEPVYKSYILAYIGVILYYALIFGGMFQLGLMDSMGSGGMPDIRDIGILYALAFGGAILFLLFVAWHEAVMLRQITKSISLGDVKLKSTFSTWDLIGLVLTNLLLVIFTLGFGAIAAQMRTWRKICRRIEVDGTLELARIHQAASRGPRSGEGMADAFDLSGGV
ncbi:MAG: DUF898 domain-containing protein [Hyphomonadaceae bacterium]|nr:MAG: hypothetical protein FD160_1120 [Caulobacteraceae bacterium]MBT9444400.1 DUF898 domain-containing protein [Hyphomonadaceae bacterium]